MNILISRRSFLAGASAFTLAGCMAPGGLLASRPKLKFGVVSDIHITDWNSTEVFRKTLKYFRDQDVDAVMIVGDMADHGLLIQLENVSKAWYEAFPNDCGLGGKHVEKLFVYGNHDPEGLRYRDRAMDKAFAVHHLTYEEAQRQTLTSLGLGKCWDKCFQEEYKPIFIKNVLGYDFIGAHWDTWQGVRALEGWFADNIGKVNVNQPFFYYQHCTPRNTIYGADSWGDDSGMSVRALSPYSNAIAFSGHSHRPLTDERSYWRGEFTSIGTSTLSYVCLPGGRENTPHHRENLDCRHGQIISVYDGYFAVQRRDFSLDEDLGDVLTFEMPTKAETFTARAVAKKNIPAFGAAAKVSVSAVADGIKVSFPGAFANPTARPFEYEVAFSFKRAEAGKKAKGISKMVFQTDFERSLARAKAAKIEYVLPKKEIPKGAVSVEVSVGARNSFGGAASGRIGGKCMLAGA